LGQIILFCLVISAFQGALAVLAIGFMLFLVWGLFFRTEQTLGLMALGALITALQVHPFATVGVIIGLAGAVLIADRKKTAAGDKVRPADAQQRVDL
jgi:hypothetical protein